VAAYVVLAVVTPTLCEFAVHDDARASCFRRIQKTTDGVRLRVSHLMDDRLVGRTDPTREFRLREVES
jgi:hypothetical protein